MTSAPVLHLHQIESLQCGGIHLSAADNELIGAHDATEKPMDLTAAFYPADHADIGAVYLRNNVGDQVFHQSKRVGNCRRVEPIVNTHSSFPVFFGANRASGNTGTQLTEMASKLSPHPFYYEYFRAAIVSMFNVPSEELQS